jgi:hypothetical protein
MVVAGVAMQAVERERHAGSPADQSGPVGRAQLGGELVAVGDSFEQVLVRANRRPAHRL